MAPGEPAWLPIDRDMVAAYTQVERETCGDCGSRKEEWGWWDEAGKFHRHRHAPYVVKATTCPGCEALERVRDSATKGAGKPPPPSWRPYLTPG